MTVAISSSSRSTSTTSDFPKQQSSVRFGFSSNGKSSSMSDLPTSSSSPGGKPSIVMDPINHNSNNSIENNDHHNNYSNGNREEETSLYPSPPPSSSGDSSIDTRMMIRGGSRSPRGSSRTRFNSASLRSNLTREQRNRDPLFFYEIEQTLGDGSMGSVVRVRKRKNVIGGSARKHLQVAVQRQKRDQKCLDIPWIGGLFRFCLDGNLKHTSPTTTNNNNNPDVSTKSWGDGSFTKSFSSWFGNNNRGGEESNTKFISIDDSNDKPSQVRVPMLRTMSTGSLGSSVQDSEIKSGETTTNTNSNPNSNSNTTIEYAMKSIHLNRVSDKNFLTELRNEIDILRKLDHPHIVRAIETFEHSNQIFIVMELCSGGDLYSRDPYTEEQAARIISAILNAISYMHARNIVHRDLKFENVLFVNNSPHAEIKLIDFGLSKVYCDKDGQGSAGVGTIYTMAPEVLRGIHTSKADIWSVGVIAYMLLSSQMPFFGRKRRHIVEQVLNGQFDFRGRRWKRISAQAKSFIEDLLVLDLDDRVDAETAMSATWLNRRFAATMRGPVAHEEDMARHAMLRYAGYTKLKKMALMVVAHKSNSEEIGILRKMFQKYDTKGEGSLGYEEFCSALGEFGHNTDDDDLRDIFDALDLDGSGKIRYTEFLAATIEAQGAISEERLAEAFDRLDSDDSGFISPENLIEILGPDFPREEIDEIIAESKLQKDNQISYAEFLHLWEEKHDSARNHQLQQMLGTTVTLSRDDSHMSLDLLGMESAGDDHVPMSGRASFIMEKHICSTKQAEVKDVPTNGD